MSDRAPRGERDSVEALRASEERLRLALSAARMLGWEWDPADGRLSLSGPAAEILGLAPGTEIATIEQAIALLHPDDRPRADAARRAAVEQGEPHVFKCRAIRPKDGAVVWLESRGKVSLDEEGRPAHARGVLIDVTAREEAERQRAAAELASQLKDELLARVSHELRTPLAAQRLWLEVLRSGRPEDRALAIDAIDKGARTQTKLIADLLDLARGMSGKLRITASIVDPTVPLEEAVSVMRPEAEARGIRVVTSFASDALHVRGDAGRLEQVVVNLLSNAVKFTPPGGRVEVILRAEGDGVVLAVRDTGAGIDPASLEAVFAPFHQKSALTQGGLGLGLAIARQLVELHGGTLRADSGGEGRGATFTVRLPRVRGEELPPAPPSARISEVRRQPLAGLSVLVVEDHAPTREGFARLLSSVGAEVSAWADAKSAVAAVAERRPVVIVSDLALPDEDGFAFIRAVRRLDGPAAATPAVAVTALARAEDAARAIAAGFQAHLAKPVEARELVDVVARLAGKSPRLGAARRPRRSWPG